MKKWMLAAALPAFSLTAPAQPKFITDSLDAYIGQAMKDYRIPGLSVAIVKDGKVVVQKGYGVKEMNSSDPVDENTLFYIASNTKLFTGMALSLLEERGRLKLDDPITKYFPGYRLYDSAATKLVSIRDMLSHRIGTTTFQGDFSYFNSLYNRPTIMRQMRLMKPSQPFRQNFGYCNSCFLTAGEIIPRINNQPWEVFVQDSLINVAGMTNTYSLSQGFEQRPNHAVPHTIAMDGSLQTLPPDRWDNLGPAASIISNAKDMAQWLLFQLNNGRREGKQLIPASVFARTRQANTLLYSNPGVAGTTQFRAYGLGVFITNYKNTMLFHHTGGASGMVSSVCFVPTKGLGIAVLTNQDNQNFFEYLRFRILNAYIDSAALNTDARELRQQQQNIDDSRKELDGYRSKVAQAGATPALANRLPGEYVNELYGRMTIEKTGDGLKATFHNHGNLTGKLEYMGNNHWLCTYSNPVYGIHPFLVEETQGRLRIRVKVNDFVEYDPYWFTKR